MEKAKRWLMTGFLVVTLVVLGPQKLEPLWDTIRHDPAIGIIVFVVLLLLVLVVARVIRQ